MKKSAVFFWSILFLAVSLTTAASDQPAAKITEFPLPTPSAAPQSIALDAQGRVWYTASAANLIGVFDPATQEFQEFPLPNKNARPHGIAIGPRGRVWFAQSGKGRMGEYNPVTGKFRDYYIPISKDPHWPVFGKQGFLWVTAQRSNRIIRVNQKNYNTGEYKIPTPGSLPGAIAVAPDGILWFCEINGNKLGRLDPEQRGRKRFTEIEFPTAAAGPRQLAIEENGAGNIWVTEYRSGKLARYNYLKDEWKEWNSPSGPEAKPYSIALAADGSVWFNEAGAGKMVRFDPVKETFSSVDLPSPGNVVHRIVRGSGNSLWLAVGSLESAGKNFLARLE